MFNVFHNFRQYNVFLIEQKLFVQACHFDTGIGPFFDVTKFYIKHGTLYTTHSKIMANKFVHIFNF